MASLTQSTVRRAPLAANDALTVRPLRITLQISYEREPFRKCHRPYNSCHYTAACRKSLLRYICPPLRHAFIGGVISPAVRLFIEIKNVSGSNKQTCSVRIHTHLPKLRDASVAPDIRIAGCFQKKSTWSSPGAVHLDNLKELAKRFRLHKSIPNFFRDYTTEDSLVAVLKRYVRNNAAFLSLTPSVASARRAGHPQTDTGGMVGADGGDGQHAIRKASSIDSASLLEGGGNTASGSLTNTAAGDGEHPHRTTGAAGGNAYTRVLSSEALQPDGAGRGAIGHTSRAPGIASSGVPHTTRAGRGRRTSSSQPRRVLQPKRPTKVRAVRLLSRYVFISNLVREYHKPTMPS